MLLVFVDEMGDKKFKEYFGICIALVNARYYATLKQKAQRILANSGWSPSVEFKGSHLFSSSSGCTDVEIEHRVEAAGKLLDLNVAESNSRMKFHYGRMRSLDHVKDYLQYLPNLLSRCLPKAPKEAGKNLIAIFCDQRQEVLPLKLHHAVIESAQAKGWVILEHVITTTSGPDTVGIMYADLVGYLAARIDTISSDSELFEGLTSEQFEQNGKIRKLRSSTELIKKVKRLTLHDYTSQATSGLP